MKGPECCVFCKAGIMAFTAQRRHTSSSMFRQWINLREDSVRVEIIEMVVKRVVVVGGGACGMSAISVLEYRLPSDWTLTLIEERDFYYWPVAGTHIGF